ncbi:MAG: hypothetical protein AAGG48_00330 [Planctomycetota bacterium]
MNGKHRRRFVVLHHEVTAAFQRSDQHHFDWMFEQGGEALQTWSTSPLESFDDPVILPVLQLADHRIRYLDYEGPISGDRGVVTRVLTGTFQPTDHKTCEMATETHLHVTLQWEVNQAERTAELEIYRNSVPESSRLDDNCDGWFLRFSP